MHAWIDNQSYLTIFVRYGGFVGKKLQFQRYNDRDSVLEYNGDALFRISNDQFERYFTL